jgi:xylobiose transport system substrate-binding protein
MRLPPRFPRAIACLLGLALIGSTAACSTTVAASGSDTVKIWALQDPQNGPIVQQGIDTFTRATKTKAALSAYSNDYYSLKLQTSLGAVNSPDIFFNWGGASLSQYVTQHIVQDLNPALRKNPAVANAFLPSVMAVAKFNGKQYGLPSNGMQPVVLFYNKSVFAQAGLQPPKTFDDLLTLVDAVKARGVTPIALPGSQTWTMLMWLEYLLDRIGGPGKFAAIAAGTSGAWADPAVRQAVASCQQLAQRGAFGSNFASITYDTAGAPHQLATGQAAMFLMGTWEYPSQLANNPDFVNSGNLGWVDFPTVAGGAGDPADVVGNPSNYFSVYSGSTRTTQAVDFVMRTLTSDAYVTALIKSGQVPAVKGVEQKLADAPNSAFTTFTYNLVAKAPSFTQSWDQALPGAVSARMLSDLQKVFLGQMSPDQFTADMSTAG